MAMAKKVDRKAFLRRERLAKEIGLGVLGLGCIFVGLGALFTVVIAGDIYEGTLGPSDYLMTIAVLSMFYGVGTVVLLFWHWATHPKGAK